MENESKRLSNKPEIQQFLKDDWVNESNWIYWKQAIYLKQNPKDYFNKISVPSILKRGTKQTFINDKNKTSSKKDNKKNALRLSSWDSEQSIRAELDFN